MEGPGCSAWLVVSVPPAKSVVRLPTSSSRRAQYPSVQEHTLNHIKDSEYDLRNMLQEEEEEELCDVQRREFDAAPKQKEKDREGASENQILG